MDKAAERKKQAQETPVTPVRSAKDAINAMYAQDADKRLSNYLASSAQEIINAGGRGTAKSAANLHRGSIQHQMESGGTVQRRVDRAGSAQRRMESARPSAAGIMKTARPTPKPQPKSVAPAMDPLARKAAPAPAMAARKRPAPTAPSSATPVVKTSLRLAPKRKAPVVMPPRAKATGVRSSDGVINGTKGQTALAKLLASHRANTTAARPAQPIQMAPAADVEASVKLMQQATRQVLGQPEPVSVQRTAAQKPKRRTARGLMQDVIRPAQSTRKSQDAQSIAYARKAATANAEYPSDSVRHRFRTAPKDYVAEPTTQAEGYVGFDDDFGDDADDYDLNSRPQTKPPVDIYGMMDEEPVGSAANLGVVEDYNPQGDTVSEGIKEQKVAQGSGKISEQSAQSGKAAPDNQKYALGGQSPFFLKSVNVEKRPLSDGPRKRMESEGTLYERPSSEPVSKKNVYAKKEESKTALPTKPTVIIPASRRSKAPLIFLLILTVVLGAAVGAFIYLCFFQYME